jgi:hypothetical protein
MMSDEDDFDCPLCMEELDISDRNFRPCPCGYQVPPTFWSLIALSSCCPTFATQDGKRNRTCRGLHLQITRIDPVTGFLLRRFVVSVGTTLRKISMVAVLLVDECTRRRRSSSPPFPPMSKCLLVACEDRE